MARAMHGVVASVSAAAGAIGGAAVQSPSTVGSITSALAGIVAIAAIVIWAMTLHHGSKTGRYPRFGNHLSFEQVGEPSLSEHDQLTLFPTEVAGSRRDGS